MSRTIVLCLLFLSLLANCAAQKLHSCRFSENSEVGRAEGIDIQRVSIVEPRRKVGATIFIPDASEPVPGIVFSHSSIRGLNNDADLRRFALALARAGAASIVLDGTIDWRFPSDKFIRPPEFRFCAGQWLMQHVNLDLTRAADAGNQKLGWIENDVSECAFEPEGPRCWPGGLWLDFGQLGQAESRNTDLMLTPQGQLRMAQFAQKYLKLKEINPEWLAQTAPSLPR
jgi:hypothetical protein